MVKLRLSLPIFTKCANYSGLEIMNGMLTNVGVLSIND